VLELEAVRLGVEVVVDVTHDVDAHDRVFQDSAPTMSATLRSWSTNA
jgi:hypothetical protein